MPPDAPETDSMSDLNKLHYILEKQGVRESISLFELVHCYIETLADNPERTLEVENIVRDAIETKLYWQARIKLDNLFGWW